MKTMKIFEPAMCCPTGICGVGVDPELLRIATTLDKLRKDGARISRYNLTSAPLAFLQHQRCHVAHKGAAFLGIVHHRAHGVLSFIA